MAAILYFTITFIVIFSSEGSVMKVEDIPLSEGEVVNIVIKEDPKNIGSVVADLSIDIDDKKLLVLPKLLGKIVKTKFDIPDLVNRFSIRNGKCAAGQRRKGPICV